MTSPAFASSAARASTSDSGTSPRSLLVIDSAFTFEAITERALQESVTCRDLNGFFRHVWTVHPFATMLTSPGWTARSGLPNVYEVSDRHTYIEGKVGRYAWLEWFGPLNFLISQASLLWRLRRLIKRERISVIRTADPLYLGLFAWLLARTTGIPFLVRVGANFDKVREVTGKPMMPRLLFSRRVEKAIEHFILPRADLVAGANQDNLEFALANGARPAASTLFRYGNLIDKRHFVDPAERRPNFASLAAFGIERGKYLLYIGRLEVVKHPEDVIHTLANVRNAGHQVKAVLAGDGRMRESLTRLAADLGMTDHVILAGNQPQGWLADAIAGAAVVVSPHTGRALSEAALGAAAIVAYDVDWQAELIENGVTGAIVPHLDRAGMARETCRLLDDSAEAQRLGRAARARALEMLDPEILDRNERDHYATLIEGVPPSAAIGGHAREPRTDPSQRAG